MGFEVQLYYHPRKEDLGYDTEQKETITKKVGKPFDDTNLEQLAAVLIAQMARRDILIYDVEVDELVKRPIKVKECKDGRGILIKGKRFSLGQTAQEVSVENVVTESEHSSYTHPHEALVHQKVNQPGSDATVDELYVNPNKSIVKRASDNVPVNQKKVLYWVYYEPYMYQAEANAMKLRCRENTKYPVHKIIPGLNGNLSQQKIVITDDTNQLVTLDEKYFTSAGKGLLGDSELGFSTPREEAGPKLAYENEMTSVEMPAGLENVPIDSGVISPELMKVPDLR